MKRYKAPHHPSDPAHPRHAEWVRNSQAGRRAAIKRKRKLWLSPRQFGYEAAIGLQSVYKLIASGELPIRVIGERRLISREQLRRFLSADAA